VIALVPRFTTSISGSECSSWQRWFQRLTHKNARSVSHTKTPPPPCYTARTLGRLFNRVTEQRVSKRHLRRAEIPHVWRWLPPALLARLMGRVLVQPPPRRQGAAPRRLTRR
jgi:hypothetical protein